ncbi:mucin-like glycoprotein [Trypanosoma conorhini]|uniref:Mucin-like glycoprotein n=1 Tax=Trypanosoma conorhini TaxID=83891 RepID=A0A3R7NNR9_9TRYP|nr:mucin-like glycoprotein [Trypanosoma conorhini]RNF05346.1 mucin-like glycoprotein [Trypanosoma conorhini]
MAMTLTVRRRAVCALAVLALLCGCCPSSAWADLSAGTGAVASPPRSEKCKMRVPVDVSCRGSGDNLRIRVRGNATWVACELEEEDRSNLTNTQHVLAKWKEAGYTVEGSEVNSCDSGVDHTEAACIAAEFLYASHGCSASCGKQSTTGETVAFTMGFMDHEGGELYREWQQVKSAVSGGAQSNADGRTGVSGEAGVCALTAAREGSDEGPAVVLTGDAERSAAAAPGAVEGPPAHGVDNAKAAAETLVASDALPEPNAQPQAGDGLAQSGVDGATGKTNAAKGSEEEGRGVEPQAAIEAGSDSTALSQPTAAVAGAKDGVPASATVPAANAAASGSEAPSNADGSDAAATLFVPAQLPLLLLAAALACAAGQW